MGLCVRSRGNSWFVPMKYILILYLVSFSTQPPKVLDQSIYPYEYKSYFQCITNGYVQSYPKLLDVGEEAVNLDSIAIKFECKPIDVT